MPAWSGLWDNVFGGAHALLNEPTSQARTIARTLAPQAMVPFATIAKALTGAAVGGTALATVAQVSARQADGMNMGGLVVINNYSVVNRPTTAADEALIDAQLTPVFAPTTYPVDRSGNSGGGLVGTINK